ncbi:hypothetical protein BN961_01270 [Afipia felis]|uniref:Uncharacterized protein n=1 Tax=Afipia felis TaxID=1035 RepID=A0A090MQJ8_AFIFE|nr:hypothetical protein BN961_01270 [Afipia felis]
MHQRDIDEHHPGERRRRQQQRGGDDFSQARACRRRFDRAVIVVTMIRIVVGVMSVRRAMSMIVMPVRVVHLVAAGATRMRAEERDEARNQRADQWQENNRLNHNPVSPSSG